MKMPADASGAERNQQRAGTHALGPTVGGGRNLARRTGGGRQGLQLGGHPPLASL